MVRHLSRVCLFSGITWLATIYMGVNFSSLWCNETSCTVISYVNKSLIQNITLFVKYRLIRWIQSPRDPWNPLQKAVSGKFHRSDRYIKGKYLPDRDNFHRFRLWRIVLILNTVIENYLWYSTPRNYYRDIFFVMIIGRIPFVSNFHRNNHITAATVNTKMMHLTVFLTATNF